MLSATRDADAAERFFRQVLQASHTCTPRVITVDKNATYPPAFESLQQEKTLPESCQLRQCKYLNNIIEIVFTPLTKTRHLAARMGGDRIADFHVTMRHEDPIHQEVHQGPFVYECGLGEASLHTLAEGSHGWSHLSQLSVPVHWRLQRLLLRRQGLLLLLEVVTSPLVFGSGDHALQIGCCQALERLSDTPLALA